MVEGYTSHTQPMLIPNLHSAYGGVNGCCKQRQNYSTVVCAVVYTKNMVHVFEGLVGPLMQRLEHRVGDNQRNFSHLCQEKERLSEDLKTAMRRAAVKTSAG